MAGTARPWLLAVALLVLLAGRLAHAQDANSLPAPAPPLSGGSNPVAPAPGPSRLVVPPEYGLPPLPQPTEPCLKEHDPLLDDQPPPPPGWFANLEGDVTGAHIKDRLSDAVRLGRQPFVFRVPSADLDWTVAPRVELGYRVGHGIGEFLVAYRGLATEGEQFTGDQGAAQLKSRLNENTLVLEYADRDLLLGPHLDMRWMFGVQLASVFFDSRASQDGGGLLQRTSSNFLGAGPNSSLQAAHPLGLPGLAFYGEIDGAALLGHLHQQFDVERSRGVAGGRGPASARDDTKTTQGVGTLGLQLGLRWTPPQYECLRFFLGYEFESWWQVGRNDATGSMADIFEHGILFRGEVTF
jgi:hypothetical protein